jgi:hypothetical protein
MMAHKAEDSKVKLLAEIDLKKNLEMMGNLHGD